MARPASSNPSTDGRSGRSHASASLIGSLPAEAIRRGRKATSVAIRDGRPEVTFAAGDTIAADLVVGAGKGILVHRYANGSGPPADQTKEMIDLASVVHAGRGAAVGELTLLTGRFTT